MFDLKFYEGGVTTGTVDSNYGIISGKEKNSKISIFVNTRFFIRVYKEGIAIVASHLLPAIAHEYIHYQRDILSKGRSQNNYLSPDMVSWLKYASQPEEISSFAVQIVEEFVLKDYPIDVILDIISGSRPYLSGNNFLDTFRDQFRNGGINSKLYHKFLRTAYDYAINLKKNGINVENPKKWDAYWDKVGKTSPNVKHNTFSEFRKSDTHSRAGIIITDGNLMLASQPTNMKRNRWLLDISAKGHIQQGETPLQAAIRECHEETNIKFEPWKLTNPIKVICDNAPLFLFLAKIDDIIPINLLSCASTFVDNFDGLRKPEVEAYLWINPRTHLHLVQKRLHPGIRYYFLNILIEKQDSEINRMEQTFEDCQIAGPMMGYLPQSMGGILSLGYKSGQVLPPPSKKDSSQNYTSIPYF
jgi:hypothetical protein